MYVVSASKSSFLIRYLIAGSVSGALLLTSGCNNSTQAASAHQAPKSLSEPIRPAEPVPADNNAAIPSNVNLDAQTANGGTARPIDTAPIASLPPPQSTTDRYAAQRPGESQPLPAYTPPPATESAIPAPASIAVNVAPAVPSAGGRTHTLAKGETLSSVSRQYNVKLREILAVNQFRDPNHLPVGTKVVIPN